MSTATSVDTAKATVEAALDALLATNDPKKMDNVAFRGAVTTTVWPGCISPKVVVVSDFVPISIVWLKNVFAKPALHSKTPPHSLLLLLGRPSQLMVLMK